MASNSLSMNVADLNAAMSHSADISVSINDHELQNNISVPDDIEHGISFAMNQQYHHRNLSSKQTSILLNNDSTSQNNRNNNNSIDIKLDLIDIDEDNKDNIDINKINNKHNTLTIINNSSIHSLGTSIQIESNQVTDFSEPPPTTQ